MKKTFNDNHKIKYKFDYCEKIYNAELAITKLSTRLSLSKSKNNIYNRSLIEELYSIDFLDEIFIEILILNYL